MVNSRATNPASLKDGHGWEPNSDFHCAWRLCPDKSESGTILYNDDGEPVEKLWTELPDAILILDSGSSSRKGVEVQVLSSAPKESKIVLFRNQCGV
jgi:hypothetical protein